MRNNNLTSLALFLLLAASSGSAQETKHFDARDMFFSSVEMLDAKKDPPSPKPDTSKTKPRAGTQTRPARPVVPPKDAETHFVSVKGPMLLGLRYSICLKTPSGIIETKPDRAFHSGDQIRINVMGNQPGYLYIISQGTSGFWTPLFPNPKSEQTSNEIVAGRRYEIPGGSGEYFTFTRDPGEEHLFVLLSKTPIANLDETIRALAGPSDNVADARINNELIGKLRDGVAPRDLEFTKISDKGSASDAGEDAVYVVNKASGTGIDARVVVDVKLNHR